MTRSLADILDSAPTPADAPEADAWSRQLAELERAAAALAEKLRHEPGLSRAAAQLFVKSETNAPGVCFRSIVWPQARKPAFVAIAGACAAGEEGARRAVMTVRSATRITTSRAGRHCP